MSVQRIADWDDAYANMPYIPDGEDFIPRWLSDAAAFRASAMAELDVPYGNGLREKFDLFLPLGKSQGIFVFVHGGYWMRFDKSHWSHFAAGALARGMTVCMPSYPLCPDVKIDQILSSVSKAVTFVTSQFAGPTYLVGHSAGGHIVSMLSSQAYGAGGVLGSKLKKTVSISGVHDLRPLLNTQLNQTLNLSPIEAATLSPALLQPAEGLHLAAWVGAAERPEFVRQNRLLADIWLGLGASVQHIEERGRHHFDVIDGLRDPNSELMRSIFED